MPDPATVAEPAASSEETASPGEEREVLFDRSDEYEAMLNQGLSLSGEGRSFFEAGRVAALERALAATGAPAPRRILDFGCGDGSTSRVLAERFSESEVVGVDLSVPTIERARQELSRHEHVARRVHFGVVDDLATSDEFDLCYCSGVLHHIEPRLRAGALNTIRSAVRPQGHFALFENNPWNPGTRWVMSRIPFDRDAVTLSPLEACSLLRGSGFEVVRGSRSLFFFPRALAVLRPTERLLERLPLGAQYWLLARRGSARPDSAG